MSTCLARMGGLARAAADLPVALRIVLLVAAVLYATGLSWGMPASDGWDVDGVAPRDIVPGLVETFTPGHYYTYPPFHLAILTLLTLPITVTAVATAGSTSLPAVLAVVLAPPFMTAMAMTARVVTVVMALGTLVIVAEIAAEIAPEASQRRAKTAAALTAAAGAPFTYYAHVTNVDVPYLFWAMLALLCLVRAMAREEPHRLRMASIFAAFAITTKDQASAMFLLSAPVLVGAWLVTDRARARSIAREALIGAGLALTLVLLADGAVTNPSGFRARLEFLTGTASQDFAAYSRDVLGRALALFDTVLAFRLHYPTPWAALLVIGLAAVLQTARRQAPARRLAALVPLAAAVSFTCCFNLLARRVEERFTLPQILSLSVYAGIGLERVFVGLGSRHRIGRFSGGIAATAFVGEAVWGCARVDAMFLGEPRYEAEAWIRAHVQRDDLIEVHGLNVYLVRFPPGMHVIRVDPSPGLHRNPMPGVDEVLAPLSEIERRRPRFVIENECYVWRYLERAPSDGPGRVISTTLVRDARNLDATRYYDRLFRHSLPYHPAHTSRFTSAVFAPLKLHASLSCAVLVYERDQDVAGSPTRGAVVD